jgi:Mrp family chromosome partitioning ATPase
MKRRITTDSMAHEFRLLRNRIEAEVNAPAIVLVTSATDVDGAGVTAFGLADSLSKSKQRTALVTTSAATPLSTVSAPDAPRRRRANDRLEAVSHSDGEGRLSVVSISPERLATISRSGVANLLEELRADHDYVVIDAGNLPKNSFGLLLVASADAALVAFRAGRAQEAADRVMLDTLERSEAKVLGVVVTDKAIIDHYQLQSESAIADRNPAEHKPAEHKPATLMPERLDLRRDRLGKAI